MPFPGSPTSLTTTPDPMRCSAQRWSAGAVSDGSRRHGVAIVSGSISAMRTSGPGTTGQIAAPGGVRSTSPGMLATTGSNDLVLATGLALGAAVLHAAWNLLIKTADDREIAAWGQFVFGGVALLPILVVTGVPAAAAWPYLAGSAVVHVFYVGALVAAYEHGDFSLAYPLARGGGALTAAVLGVIALGDGLGVGGWVALLVVTIGL